MDISPAHLAKAVVAGALLLGLTACGDTGLPATAANDTSDTSDTSDTKDTKDTKDTTPPPDRTPVGSGTPEPPLVAVRHGEDTTVLTPYGFCYRWGCVDGSPPADPPRIAGTDLVRVDFADEGWSFEAVFRRAGHPRAHGRTVVLERAADGSYVLRPPRRDGAYLVTLVGRGKRGDITTVFGWTT